MQKTVLSCKLVFHLPKMKYQNGTLVDISEQIQTFTEEFSELLDQNHLDSNFYAQIVTGYYQKRHYPEQLITLFCHDNIDSHHVILLFQKLLEKYCYLGQESIAVEQNTQLMILYPEN